MNSCRDGQWCRYGPPGRGALAFVVFAVALMPACRSTIDPAAVDDAQTAARIKTALVNDPQIGDLAIEVRVVHGVAVLSGRVSTQAQADRVAAVTRSVPGVTAVAPEIRVGGEPATVPATPPRQATPDSVETESAPSLLAVGASLGWSLPGLESLKNRASISPSFRLGSPHGLGPAIAFDWFHADLQSIGGTATLTRVHVKPFMGGLGYTVVSNRLAVTPSIVAGYAFNSLTALTPAWRRVFPSKSGTASPGGSARRRGTT